MNFGVVYARRLQILNANHLMDKEKLRAFLLTAQHQFMGGFCKIPEESGFPGTSVFVLSKISLVSVLLIVF